MNVNTPLDPSSNSPEDEHAIECMEEAGEWLLRLQDETLSEEELTQWLQWCEAHPENVAAFESMQSLWRRIPQTLVLRKAEPQPVQGLRRGIRRYSTRMALAAVVAFVAVTTAILVIQHQRNAPDSLTTVTTQIQAPPRVNHSSVLPDGSQVDLGAGSQVALEFTPERRRLRLQDGMAFFRVTPDKARPFVVDAGAVDVTAVGTTFNIRRNGERVVVTVEEGLVRIDQDDASPLQAGAGYQLTYDGSSRETRLAPVSPEVELAWREGRLVYNGEPLAIVIENVNRYAERPITLADPSLARLRYTGTVLTDSIDTWLEALPQAFPITVRQEQERTVLSARAP